MINLDYVTLKLFFEENIDFFIGARLQKIQQPTRHDLILHLRNNSESRKLYISINPQVYHLAFMWVNGENRWCIEIPKHPPMFCMLLRKYLEGCKISDALVVEGERILELHFEIFDELSERRLVCLAIELMGKHSNIILYDKETSLIIGCAHNIGSEKSKYRELKGGLKYIYPPGVNALAEIKTPLYKTFDNNLSISENLDSYYSKIQENIILKSEKNKLETLVKAKLKKVQSSVDKITTLLDKRNNTEKYKLYGELLTANIYQKKDFQKCIEVFDYNSNQNITIELDETKSLKDNAQRYFKLYTKAKTTKEKSSELLRNLNIEKEYLENTQYSIAVANSIDELSEIKHELGIDDIVKKEKVQTIVQKVSIKGFDVYMGKNNRQNDYIVSKLAKDNDFWFHTKNCAGSHVLLKVYEKEPDEEILFECCKLARENSSAKMPSKVEVIYTRAKHVQKPPKAPLGYVIFKNEKEVLV